MDCNRFGYRYISKLVFCCKETANLLACCGDAITILTFSNRFKEDKNHFNNFSCFILVFFTVYAASCFVTVGKLFSTLFEVKYVYMMIVCYICCHYTFIGGFLAESASDFMQGIIMVFALTAVLLFGIFKLVE